MSAFGEWVKRIREKEGLSHAGFADRVHVHRVTVSNWEAAKEFIPRRDSIAKIRRAFPDAPPPPDSPTNGPAGSPKTITLNTYEARELAVYLDQKPRSERTKARDLIYGVFGRPARKRSQKPGPKGQNTGP